MRDEICSRRIGSAFCFVFKPEKSVKSIEGRDGTGRDVTRRDETDGYEDDDESH